MNLFRVFIVTAGVVQTVTVGPAVVPNTGAGWLFTVIVFRIGEGGSELRDVLQFFNELKLARSER